ncbi:hypothetical protein CTEN210_16974 [Chaetoceros tenuissimus]|uniref:Prolyl 4-hydroxylase alpha subunit domain-containing protein n=1 Tax=Chaetoceros tenuissimus TaxID=426638 RepID=A0AAD3HEY0_9STRA|nr:hypothetical protein CTEN210_16974 [Chaetoceros tenuissimus]
MKFSLLIGAFCLVAQKAKAATLDENLDYKVFPLRTNEEAAVVEWGSSAIISALDGAVANFGPQTSLGAFFEVETAPILASPINGRGRKKNISPEDDPHGEAVPYPGPLDNADDVEGNMLVMTNENSNMSAVAMARVAKDSGAAALMIVNFDKANPDSILSLKTENEEEEKFAAEHIDIPVFMVSLASGNLITSATYEEGMKEEDIVNNGMPDRVRLYAAGDRPFFEDVTSKNPILYLIHNLLNEEECSSLISQAKNKFSPIDDSISNLLENIVASNDRKRRAFGVEEILLWKGQINGHMGKQVDERIEQVTGYPREQFSDWQIMKFEKEGSKYELTYDMHPIYQPVATITVFLNELEGSESGGDVVFPDADSISVKIKPKQGLAIVHHNSDFEGNIDAASLHGDLPLNTDEIKYIAKKYVYATPLAPTKRIVLPIFALLNGGRLPRWIVTIYNYLLVKFGLEQGNFYFDKLFVMGPVFLILSLVNALASFLAPKKAESSKSKKD